MKLYHAARGQIRLPELVLLECCKFTISTGARLLIKDMLVTVGSERVGVLFLVISEPESPFLEELENVAV